MIQMNTAEILDQVQNRAGRDEDFRKMLLQTAQSGDPLGNFCEVCRRYGYEIYPMEVIQAGEELYAAMKRSTNGGGENSPVLAGENDLYEMLMASLANTYEGQ